MILSTKGIEKALDVKFVPFLSCMGLDTASRTGWCTVKTDPANLTLDYGFIDVKSKDRDFKYHQYINIFNDLLSPEHILVIEESFLGRNVKSFQLLSRLGGMAYAIAHLKKVEEKSFLLTSRARKRLNFKGNLKKAIFHEEFLAKTKIDLEDEDIIDALILALNGVIECE